MSGHSKWASIKHKKAANDSKKGKIWSKYCSNCFKINKKLIERKIKK